MQVEGGGSLRYNPAMSIEGTIAFIGGGNMTEALISGLLTGGRAHPQHLHATDILPERRVALEHRFQVRVGKENREAAGQGDIVILCVEPQVLDEVCDEISSAIKPQCLVISVAAGYPIARVTGRLSTVKAVVRAMPNTPSTILAGVTALSFGPGVTEDQACVARTIFQSIGRVVTVEERLMDAVTGLSGSGPAYVYLAIEALADGGVKMGLSRPTAALLAAQTFLGAARMVLETGEHPAQLKDRVASPGGTTIAGLHELERGLLRAAIMNAVKAATQRSGELGLG